MDGDDITDAFTRWKVAQDAFLATEQRFFNTARTGAHQISAIGSGEPDPLFIEVQVKRAHAEVLLLAAMKLLHERRQQGASTSGTPDDSKIAELARLGRPGGPGVGGSPPPHHD
jgi:hypothetical protein